MNLAHDINTIRELAEGIADGPFLAELDTLAQKAEKDKLYLVITGLFKRGKSSLVNALLGKKLAPVPLTALLSAIPPR